MGLFGIFEKSEAENKQYYGWKMRTSHFDPHDIVLKAIDNYVTMVAKGTNQFVLLLPPKEIKKCNGMKVTQSKESGLHFEIIEDKTYAKDQVSLDYVLQVMKEFVVNGKVPSTEDYYEFEEVIDIASFKELSELLIKNMEALDSLNQCFESPKSFYKNNKSMYDERFISGDSDEEIMWFALVEALIANKVSIELDYAEDIENTIDSLNMLNKELAIKKEWFQSDDLADNLKVVNKEWKTKGYCIAYADINSDSYVLMILSLENLKKAKALAKNINRKIAKV